VRGLGGSEDSRNSEDQAVFVRPGWFRGSTGDPEDQGDIL
jgi:hypothetical protein